MNEKFHDLPPEKREMIINAGYRVFAKNSYRKSSMQEAADEALISKSLLFHYFLNKKEFYLYLWDHACKLTLDYLNRYQCYDSDDLFEMMERGMRAKIELMKLYPEMTAFVIRAYYEKESEIKLEIQKSYQEYFKFKAENALSKIDRSRFVSGLDIKKMYREMILASQGYLWEIMHWDGRFDGSRLEKDFEEMLEFWKRIYLRKD